MNRTVRRCWGRSLWYWRRHDGRNWRGGSRRSRGYCRNTSTVFVGWFRFFRVHLTWNNCDDPVFNSTDSRMICPRIKKIQGEKSSIDGLTTFVKVSIEQGNHSRDRARPNDGGKPWYLDKSEKRSEADQRRLLFSISQACCFLVKCQRLKGSFRCLFAQRCHFWSLNQTKDRQGCFVGRREKCCEGEKTECREKTRVRKTSVVVSFDGQGLVIVMYIRYKCARRRPILQPLLRARPPSRASVVVGIHYAPI